MITIAYLSNQFPAEVEPYVAQEINEFRRREIKIIPCSVRRPDIAGGPTPSFVSETQYLQPLRIGQLLRAGSLCLQNVKLLADLLIRVVIRGSESPLRRFLALLHTWLGASYALSLKNQGVTHIHVHHGYFASWVGMTAARLLGISFSMTLHGSDLLLHAAYLDTKLNNCDFCTTISEFNRQHILTHYPGVDPAKIIVCRMGAEAVIRSIAPVHAKSRPFLMLAVGRLHAVKDHAFLIRACGILKERGVKFVCVIAGDGPQRVALHRQIHDLALRSQVRLIGHCCRAELDDLYSISDLVVLTSRSEGIPLVLMEAMARGKVVLAPAITGIPELVRDRQTGFLYESGSLRDFAAKVEMIRQSQASLLPLCHAARDHVEKHFNQKKNVAAFVDVVLHRLRGEVERIPDENSVLQQI